MNTIVHDLSVLLRLRLTLWRRPGQSGQSGQTAQSGRGRASSPNRRWIVRGVLLLIFGFAAFSLANLVSGLAAGPEGRAILGTLLVWASSSVFLVVFFAAIPVVLALFTYNSDLKLLLLTPLSPRVLMGEKILSACLGFAPFLLLLGGPILYAIGRAAALGPGYDLLAVLLLILLPVVPVSLAALITVGALRWIPPARARTVATLMGTFLGLSAYIASRLLTGQQNGAAARRFLTAAPPAWLGTLPPTWPGHALAAVAEGQAGAALSYLAATLVLCILVAALAIALSARLFATGWATYQEVGRRKRPAGQAVSSATRTATDGSARILSAPIAAPGMGGAPAFSAVMPPLPALADVSAPAVPHKSAPAMLHISAPLHAARRPRWWPLLGKEWRSLRRDPQVWARLLYSLVVVGFGLSRFIGGARPGASSATALYDGTLTIFIYLVLISLAAPIVNREGRAFLLLRLSPLSARDILLAKWCFCAVPVLVLVEVLLCVMSVALRLSPGPALLSGVALGGLAVALSGGLITINLIWPRLDWDNPRRQVSGTASLVASIGGLALGGAVYGLLLLASIVPMLAVVALAIVLLAGVEAVVIALVILFAPSLLQALIDGEPGRKASTVRASAPLRSTHS